MSVCMCVSVRACVTVCMYVYVWVGACVCMCVNVYTHFHTHTHAHVRKVTAWCSDLREHHCVAAACEVGVCRQRSLLLHGEWGVIMRMCMHVRVPMYVCVSIYAEPFVYACIHCTLICRYAWVYSRTFMMRIYASARVCPCLYEYI